MRKIIYNENIAPSFLTQDYTSTLVEVEGDSLMIVHDFEVQSLDPVDGETIVCLKGEVEV